MPLWRNAAAILSRVSQRQSIYSLPINVNHVRDAVQEISGGADIRFLFVDLDINKVRGYFKKGYITSGVYASDSQLIANIYISTNQSEEWQNFVAVKEMLHLLDGETYSTRDREAVSNLLEDIAADDMDIASLDASQPRAQHYLVDVGTAVGAVEILFPYELRNFYRQKYMDGIIADYELAQAAMIPERYVRFSMRPKWFETTAARRAQRQIQDIKPPN